MFTRRHLPSKAHGVSTEMQCRIARLKRRYERSRLWRRPALVSRVAVGLAFVIAGTCVESSPVLAGTAYVDGVSDQNLAYWGAFFSTGLTAIAPVSLGEGWQLLPARVAYARYVAQWNETAPFRTWLEHVPSGVTVDLALTNYHTPESYVEGSPNYPSTPLSYLQALEAFLNLGEALHHPVAVVEPWNEPNNQGGYREAAEAVQPAEFADEAQRVCSTHDCSVVAGDIEDVYGAAGEYLRVYKSHLDFTPRAWGVHPYRAVDNYGVAPSGMSEFEEQCGECHPWFTEIGVFICERTAGHGVYEGPAWQREHAEDLTAHVMRTYQPEHVFYYELKVPGSEAVETQEAACVRGDTTDSALYGVHGEARPAASVVFEP